MPKSNANFQYSFRELAFTACFFGGSVLSLSCTKNDLPQKPLPNIILISADDLGWSDLGCYGSEINTPNIDSLAENGMRFTNFHNTSKSFPSRATLLTGAYAQYSGYDKTFTEPLKNVVTLGEVLREAGYRTLWSGKHHGKDNPIFRGFDRYYGLKDGACNHFNPGNQRSGEGVPARKERNGEKTNRAWCIDSTMYEPYTPEEKDFYTTDYFTNYAIQWLDEYKDENKPIFLYLAYTAPHDPLMAWPKDIAKYKNLYNSGYEPIRESRYEKQLSEGLISEKYKLTKATYTPWAKLSQQEKESEAKKMEVYAAMIDRMDQNIGRLLKKLRETGLDQNTLILFVSDNGASAEMVRIDDDYGEIGSMTKWTSLGANWANVSNTPFKLFKNYSYEGGINTPLIAYWPKNIKKNSFSNFQGHFIDIMPTFVEISGAIYPEEYKGEKIVPIQGESLYTIFKGEKKDRKGQLYWEWNKGQAGWKDGWKIVKNGIENPWNLYDLNEDPTETTNLSNENSDRVKEIESLFFEWKKDVENYNK